MGKLFKNPKVIERIKIMNYQIWRGEEGEGKKDTIDITVYNREEISCKIHISQREIEHYLYFIIHCQWTKEKKQF